MVDFYSINIRSTSLCFIHTLHTGNWVELEIGIKEFIAKRNLDTDVYTGTHGISTLPDINGKPKALFLSMNAKGNRIPVPLFYYKVVIAESIDAGIVFIGGNILGERGKILLYRMNLI